MSDSIKRYMWSRFLLGCQESPYSPTRAEAWAQHPKHNASSASKALHMCISGWLCMWLWMLVSAAITAEILGLMEIVFGVAQ